MPDPGREAAELPLCRNNNSLQQYSEQLQQQQQQQQQQHEPLRSYCSLTSPYPHHLEDDCSSASSAQADIATNLAPASSVVGTSPVSLRGADLLLDKLHALLQCLFSIGALQQLAVPSLAALEANLQQRVCSNFIPYLSPPLAAAAASAAAAETAAATTPLAAPEAAAAAAAAAPHQLSSSNSSPTVTTRSPSAAAAAAAGLPQSAAEKVACSGLSSECEGSSTAAEQQQQEELAALDKQQTRKYSTIGAYEEEAAANTTGEEAAAAAEGATAAPTTAAAAPSEAPLGLLSSSSSSSSSSSWTHALEWPVDEGLAAACFTPLLLVKAFKRLDKIYNFSKRQFAAPSRNECRVLLNLAQVLASRGQLKLLTLDGDETLYPDGGQLQQEEMAQSIAQLLQRGVNVAVVTGAGYGYEAPLYAQRLGCLFRVFQKSNLLPAAAKRFFLMGGESNYLLSLSGSYKLEPVPESQWRGYRPFISAAACKQLMDLAEKSLFKAAKELNLKGTLIRKQRAVG
ncbi:IMP-specific 5'-nucleotidase 1, related, partial [Eimeria tenella]